MRENFNGLSPGQTERLAILLEELGEAQQVIGKILRHGWTPTDNNVAPQVQYNNRADLELELGQVLHAIRLLGNAGDINAHTANRHADARELKIRPYCHHQ